MPKTPLARCGLVIVTLLASVAASATARLQGQPPAGTAPGGTSFWCPMHPEIRGAAGDKCPKCRMALVAVTSADYQPYVLTVDVSPRALRAGRRGRARFTVLDPATNATVRQFRLLHERVFHLFVLSRDLQHFAHVHPQLKANGQLEVDLELPRPGAYQLIADFLPEGGMPQLVQRSVVTAGYTGSLVAVPILVADLADKVVRTTRVKLSMPPPIAGREQLIAFDLDDESTGAPATDLEPYLGATGHLLLVSADLAVAVHSHPVADVSAQTGPMVVFQVLFPRAGDYKIWAQFQRDGKVITAAFTVPVKDAE